MDIFCGDDKCGKRIKPEDKLIICMGACGKTYHAKCMKLSDYDINLLNTNKHILFMCEKCPAYFYEIKNEIRKLRALMTKNEHELDDKKSAMVQNKNSLATTSSTAGCSTSTENPPIPIENAARNPNSKAIGKKGEKSINVTVALNKDNAKPPPGTENYGGARPMSCENKEEPHNESKQEVLDETQLQALLEESDKVQKTLDKEKEKGKDYEESPKEWSDTEVGGSSSELWTDFLAYYAPGSPYREYDDSADYSDSCGKNKFVKMSENERVDPPFICHMNGVSSGFNGCFDERYLRYPMSRTFFADGNPYAVMQEANIPPMPMPMPMPIPRNARPFHTRSCIKKRKNKKN